MKVARYHRVSPRRIDRLGDQSVDLRTLRTHSLGDLNYTMMVCLPSSVDLLSLRKLVEKKLCEIGTLEPDQFPLTERSVLRANRVCGVYFCLHGPRSVKLTAIADFDRSSLICYGTDGSRSMEEKIAC